MRLIASHRLPPVSRKPSLSSSLRSSSPVGAHRSLSDESNSARPNAEHPAVKCDPLRHLHRHNSLEAGLIRRPVGGSREEFGSEQRHRSKCTIGNRAFPQRISAFKGFLQGVIPVRADDVKVDVWIRSTTSLNAFRKTCNPRWRRSRQHTETASARLSGAVILLARKLPARRCRCTSPYNARRSQGNRRNDFHLFQGESLALIPPAFPPVLRQKPTPGWNTGSARL
jgi:hypothetical protein